MEVAQLQPVSRPRSSGNAWQLSPLFYQHGERWACPQLVSLLAANNALAREKSRFRLLRCGRLFLEQGALALCGLPDSAECGFSVGGVSGSPVRFASVAVSLSRYPGEAVRVGGSVCVGGMGGCCCGLRVCVCCRRLGLRARRRCLC